MKKVQLEKLIKYIFMNNYTIIPNYEKWDEYFPKL
jgi:hypothetical protein